MNDFFPIPTGIRFLHPCFIFEFVTYLNDRMFWLVSMPSEIKFHRTAATPACRVGTWSNNFRSSPRLFRVTALSFHRNNRDGSSSPCLDRGTISVDGRTSPFPNPKPSPAKPLPCSLLQNLSSFLVHHLFDFWNRLNSSQMIFQYEKNKESARRQKYFNYFTKFSVCTLRI